MSKVFVSWSKETKAIAEALKKWINGFDPTVEVWVSSEEILGGQKWRDEIDNALSTSDFAIVCIGPSALKSPWVLYEIGAIGHMKPIIPLNFHVSTKDTSIVLANFQSIEILPPSSLCPNCDSLIQLFNSILAITNSKNISLTPKGNEAFLSRVENFGRSRKEKLIEKLKNTKRSDTLIEVLKFIDSNMELSPRDLSENRALKDLLGKKYLVALSIFLLVDFGLVEIDNYENITSGRVVISTDAKLLLFD